MMASVQNFYAWKSLPNGLFHAPEMTVLHPDMDFLAVWYGPFRGVIWALLHGGKFGATFPKAFFCGFLLYFMSSRSVNFDSSFL